MKIFLVSLESGSSKLVKADSMAFNEKLKVFCFFTGETLVAVFPICSVEYAVEQNSLANNEATRPVEVGDLLAYLKSHGVEAPELGEVVQNRLSN